MKDMEASEMVAILGSESKETPESTLSPNPVSNIDGVSATKGVTPILDTNDDTVETNGDVVATNEEAANVNIEAVTTNVEVVASNKEDVKTNAEATSFNKEDETATNVEAVTTNVEAVVTNGETVIEKNKESLIYKRDKCISQPNVGVKRTKGSLARDLKKIRLFKDSDEEGDPDDPLPQVNDNSSNDRVQNELQKKIESIPSKSNELEKLQTEANILLEEANEVLMGNDDKENKKHETKLKSKLKRLSRKELENLIIKRLNIKLINDHELGKLKALSEKLKYTLENNKKKTAQFYKEVDDLKKVTQKLMQDHQARKGQYVTPIRTQRSVGIHANEKYIRQGSMFVSNGTGPYRLISPSPGASKGPLKTNQPTTPPASTIQTQTAQPVSTSTPVQTYRAVPAASSSGTQILRQNPMVQIPGPMVQPPQPATRPPPPMVTIPRTPMVQVPRSAVTGGVISSNTHTVNSVGSSLMSVGPNRISAQIVTPPQGNHTSTIGSLNVRTTQNAVVNAPTSGIGATLRPAFIQTPGGGTQQVLLYQQLPTNGSIPNTLLVSNAGSTMTTGLTTTLVRPAQVTNTSSSTLTNPPSVIGSFNAVKTEDTPPMGAYVAAANVVATATSQVIHRHPAPLPPPPSHEISAIKHSAPTLTLKKVAGKENSIVLSWNMNKADNPSCIGHYHLFSYQEGTAPPACKLWKKVGMVKALELPMACTLTQFTPGHKYHFAVRAVYGAGRVGPFSEPRSIHLDV